LPFCVARGLRNARAHFGVYTWHAIGLRASRIIAIEPVPVNLECLRRNLETEIEDGVVTVYPKGVWDCGDVLEMNLDPEASNAHSFIGKREGSTSLELPVTTIDSIVLELGLPQVDFIKMDIEGSERNAIAGAESTIIKSRPRMCQGRSKTRPAGRSKNRPLLGCEDWICVDRQGWLKRRPATPFRRRV